MKPYEIAEDELILNRSQKPLGEGGFGQVFSGTWQGTHVAVKILSCRLTGELEKEFHREMETMLKLQGCPKLVRLYGAVLDGTSQMMVMELMPKGNLNDLLRSQKNLDWQSKYKIALDVAYGLKYLHDRNILHRDLKSMNVLLDKDSRAKIADFGLAKIKGASKSHATTKQSTAGTLLWMAPELLGLRAQFANASDIYALGMVLYEMLVHHFPFETELEGRDAMILLPEIKQGTRPELPLDGPEAFKTLIERCWQQVPANRPIASDVIKALANLVQTQGNGNDPHLSQQVSNLSIDAGVHGDVGRTHHLAASSLNAREFNTGPVGDSAVHTHRMFKAPHPVLNQSKVNQFLQHVALGEQDKAEAMLRETPALVLGKGTCKDHAGRTFKNITGFQYALWALDWHMWKMILPYFDKLPEGKAAATEQCQSQETLTKGLGHGPRYKMEDLVNALKTYVDRYVALCQAKNWDELKRLWVQGVGGAQRQTVAHVAQAYCNLGRSFDPCPDWKSGEVRGVWIIDPMWWTNSSCGWARGSGLCCIWNDLADLPASAIQDGIIIGCMKELGDSAAIAGLCRIRTAQLSELKSSLAIPSPSAHP